MSKRSKQKPEFVPTQERIERMTKKFKAQKLQKLQKLNQQYPAVDADCDADLEDEADRACSSPTPRS